MVKGLIYNQIHFLLLFSSFILGNEINKEFGHFIIAANYLLIILQFVINSKDRSRILFSPSFLTVSYISVFLILGSFIFKSGIVFSKTYIHHYESWNHCHLINLFFMLCNLAAMHSLRLPSLTIRKKPKDSISDLKIYLIISIIIILTFSFLRNYLSMIIGGYVGQVQTFFFLLISYILLKKDNKYRYFFYFIIVLYFSIISPFGKRAAAQFFVSLSFLESIRYFHINLNLKKIISISLVTVVFFSIIIYMSIRRGYGDFEINNIFQPFKYIPEYISNDNFAKLFAENLELNYTYFHSNQSVNYAIEDLNNISLGSTIIKPIFIFIPRSIFEKKPDSMIKIYTSKFDKHFYNRGGSYPICLYSEFFWNFHYLGIFFIFILFYLINQLYLRLVYHVRNDSSLKFIWLLFFYHYFLVYVRGSGLDLFFIYILIGWFINECLNFTLKLLKIPNIKQPMTSRIS
tara:strand:- start:1039 stop:2418 length:1380 start_codon:yes stop_codon:yes gene_type:complete